MLTVPTVDISSFRRGGDEAERDAVARAVDRAARDVGFMQVVGHGVDAAALAAFTGAMDAFFALDPEAKAKYRCPPGVNRGYSPPKSEALRGSLGLASAADLFEAMNVGATRDDFPGLDLPADDYAPNVFPAEVPGFEAAVTRWFGEAQTVARTMTRVFGRALGLGEDYFAAFTGHSVDVLRMNNYRLPSADAELEPDQEGMGAHTDYGIVTVLWADPVPGLEIHLHGEWHPVLPRADGLLVNLGDALARWTNDQWISTMHRVAPPRVGGRLVPRRSAAFFHDGDVDAVIECLPGCVTDDRPALYEPVTIGEHLRAKLGGSRGGRLNGSARREAARLGGG
ncbi:isopenicillin N synthase family dioxygenase [Actinomadura atramentaria]|uniref:isopenicillin N synthase family dioxygenase n=1 Tax=Actinomadura atramentaria TaxID=1990 RepID=UPI0003728665|nr:2-oxoglutarate and iron-dependent oxygenase domain-containing protein [Actinomadura atramentaria]